MRHSIPVSATSEAPRARIVREDQPEPEPRWSRLKTLLRLLRRSKEAMVGTAVILLVAATAVFAPFLTGDPLRQDLSVSLQPPGWMPGGDLRHPLGTDVLGRDQLSRLIYAARVSLVVGLVSVVVACVVGVPVGLLSGFLGGWVDSVLMRLADIQLSFPMILLALTIVALLGPSLTNVIITIGITSWVPYARIVRSTVLSLKGQPFVEAARAIGCGTVRILTKHLLPNAWAPVIIVATLQVGRAIIMESSLSFLGLGVRPPTPTWGGILADGRTFIFAAWWLAVPAGLAILITVLGVNLLGNGLRYLIDPRLRVEGLQ
jgi:peptide/nickel transport system permease protein